MLKYDNTLPRFHYFILAVTLIPLLTTPLGIAMGAGDLLKTITPEVMAIAFANGHVAATSFFFVDKNSRRIIIENKNRLIYFPLLISAIFTVIILYFGVPALTFVVFLNTIYLFYHYQRQNFGLISLANKGLPREARKLIDISLFAPVVSGFIIFGVVKLLLGSSLSVYLPTREALFTLAWSVYIFGLLALLAFFLRYGRYLNAVSAMLMVAGCLFFLPLLLFPDNALMAFGSFATAHGAQYLVIMSYTAAGTNSKILILRAFCCVISVCAFLQLLALYPLLFGGLLYGLTWGHYLIDARIWKLSLPDSREYILSRIKKYI